MNIPKPTTANNYDKISLKLSTAEKEVTGEACEELRQAPSTDNSSVIDTEISCNGTWQRRWLSSLNGVVAAISMKTGKIRDIKAMSRPCKACNLNGNLETEDHLAYMPIGKNVMFVILITVDQLVTWKWWGQKEYGNGQ